MMWAALLALATSLAGQASSSKEEQKKDDAAPPEQKQEEVHRFEEVVVVTATRTEQPIEETVALATVVSAEKLTSSPSLVLDDALRQVPGFSLFRRSSSLVAHPTTQGVSLRGIGPSGAGRSLVLFDEIPLNDPFGGWIQWSRVPLLALRSVEVVRGATSQLYGSSALGGTIHLLPRPASADTFEARAQFGNRESYEVDVLASDQRGEWGYLVAGRLFNTDGFYIVSEADRGAVDAPARSEHQSLFGRLTHGKFHVGMNLFREERDNGTQLQNNSTHLGMLDAGFAADRWAFKLYAQEGRFESTFSRILPNRSQEFLTAEQNIPSIGLGGSFTLEPGPRGLLVGTDWRFVRSEHRDQNLFGVYLQDLLSLHSRVDLLLGVRVDGWENEAIQATVNPRVGVLYRAAPRVVLRASGYRGFRAPTLNELYRPFRVGNVNTLADPNLSEEYLWGVEGGGDFHPSSSVLLRLNAFWSSLRDAVGNVTLTVTPQLITRQRQNIGPTTVKGLEAEATAQMGPRAQRFQMRAAYLYSNARVDSTGLRLPQVPLHQAYLGLEYDGWVNAGVGARFVAEQFDDDLNTLPLAGYAVVELSLRRQLSRHFDVFFSVENLLDAEYPVGRTPIVTLGTPRLVHGGLAVRLGR
jgi:outer membrane receptor protein involved in Fe transport